MYYLKILQRKHQWQLLGKALVVTESKQYAIILQKCNLCKGNDLQNYYVLKAPDWNRLFV